MIKNETKIYKNPSLNSLSEKENINFENMKEINKDKIQTLYKKYNEGKHLLINNNTITENSLENQTTANKNYNTNNSNDKNIINIMKSSKKNNLLPLSINTNYTSKGKGIELNTRSNKKLFKPFYTAFSNKNIIKVFSSNKVEVSSFTLLKKSNTPNKNYILNKLNKDNIQNFISTNKDKDFFSSLLFKNNSYKNIANSQLNKNKKDGININSKNNKISLKYSKNNNKNKKIIGDKLNNIFEKIQIKKNDKKEINIENEKEKESDKNINMNKNKIPFNQKIFKKIIEEVKDEKNYVQKVVHRKLMNQREYFRISSIDNHMKKYDSNTYNYGQEIETKKIQNSFNSSVNKDENINNNIKRNFSAQRYLNINRELNEKNKLNKSCANDYHNNLTEGIIPKKKNTIKIKKIPLNKLKNRIKVNNQNISSQNYYNNDMDYNTRRIYLQKNNSIRFSDNSFDINLNNKYLNTNNFQRATEIPKNNKSFYCINNNDYENTQIDNKRNILYNKVNLRKKASKKIQINLNNTTLGNKNVFNEANQLNNIPSYNYSKKLFYEKKTGFKKKLAGFSSEKQKNFGNSFCCLNSNYINYNDKTNKKSIYNKKINNNYINTNIRNNNDNSTYTTNITSHNNNINLFTSESIAKYDSKYNFLNKTKNINYQNLRQNIFNKEYETNSNMYNTKEEIKLEQIITLLNFEDLLIVEDKLNIILKLLKENKSSFQQFFDLFNYFFSSSLKSKFEQIYRYLLTETEAVKIFINNCLILVIICYDFCFNINKNNNNIKFSLYESLRLIYINLLMIITPIKNKIKNENKDFYNLRLIEMSGINNIINKNLINFNNNNTESDDDISFNRELLHNNTNLIIKNISLIIKSYKNELISELYYTIQTEYITLEDINTFFRQKILREDYIGCSVLASTFLKEKENFSLCHIPYITTPNKKKYSLVLDLDETLIHFKVNHDHNDEGVLKLRPGINTFLEVIKEYYELILFTEASEAYTELIIETFNKKNIFDYKFYRQHTIIIGQDFVKDLQRIGRPLDKIIIIDNIEQNFRMQKNNGILIKPFYGEDSNDQALVDLIPILVNIAKDNLDTRNGLVKYRDEIITKITSNLFRRNNNDKI